MIRLASLGAVIFLGTLAVACGSGGTTPGSTSTSGPGGGSATTTAGTTTTTVTSGTGGSGGGSGSSAASTAATTTGASTGAGGAGGGDAVATHLLISEIGVAPAGGEFIEIYNPTSAAVDLSSYYISDNASYHDLAQGAPWAPVTSKPGTDFLAQFPAGASIAPGAVLVIAGSPAYELTFGNCPDFILSTTPISCAKGTAQAMVAPANGGIGDQTGTLLSNDHEMVILFWWSGAGSAPVEDVDYLTWGAVFDTASRVDKTGIAGYKPDTARGSQKAALAPPAGESLERCGSTLETGEKSTDGNGITGHDETSEPLDGNFKVQAKPTPGLKNACL